MSSNKSDAASPSRARLSFRHSFSLNSLLRASSRSPDRSDRETLETFSRTLQPGRGDKPPGPFAGPYSDSKVSFTLTNSGLMQNHQPVLPEEFADLEDSQDSAYTEEQTRDALSIYLIIQDYDDQRRSFRFNEEFDVSSDSSRDLYLDTLASVGDFNANAPDTSLAASKSNKHSAVLAAPTSARFPALDTIAATPTPEGNMSRTLTIIPQTLRSSADVTDKRASVNTDDTSHSRLPEADLSPFQAAPVTSPLAPLEDSGGIFDDSVEGLDLGHASMSRGTNASLSSGELLTRLDYLRPQTNRDSVLSELAVAHLTAGVDSSSELPVMLYTVHAKDRQRQSWGEDLARGEALQSNPPAVQVPIFRGTLAARRISILTENSRASKMSRASKTRSPAAIMLRGSSALSQGSLDYSTGGSRKEYRADAERPLSSSSSDIYYSQSGSIHNSHISRETHSASHSGSRSNPSSLGVFSNLSGRPIAEDVHYDATQYQTGDPKERRRQAQRAAHLDAAPEAPTGGSTPYASHIASPPRSASRSFEKGTHHENMFSEKHEYARNEQIYQGPQFVTWSNWLVMMALGLVAVPIYFLLPLGAFDHGGFLRSRHPVGKGAEVNWRYHRRYSRAQKMASLVIGLLWLAIVLAMIGVGFGLGLR